MNRVLKFRVWDENNKLMRNITLMNTSKGYPRFEAVWLDDDLEPGFLHADETPIMQFTGLKDKNNIEIYEGDIVQHDFMKAKIIYGYCGFEFEWLTPRVVTIRNREREPIFSNVSLIFEVIGNIYENLELMGKENENEKSLSGVAAPSRLVTK